MDESLDCQTTEPGPRAIGSVITGLPKPVPEGSRPTGTLPFVTGYAPTLSATTPAPANPRAFGEALADSLPTPVRSWMRSKWNQDITEVVGWEWNTLPKPEDVSELLTAARMTLANSLRPLHPNEIIQLLRALNAATASRQISDADQQAKIALFTQFLGQVPADSARYAVKKCIKRSTFWPSWAEIEGLIDEAEQQRKWLESLMATPFPQIAKVAAVVPAKDRQTRTMSYIEQMGKVKPKPPEAAPIIEETDEELAEKKRQFIIDNFPG